MTGSDRKGLSMLSRVACVVVVALCALVADASPSRAVAASAAPPAGPLADGVWIVQGRAIPGRRCGDWLVRLTNAQGRLSGVLALARSSVPIDNLALLPDGSFSGATQAGVVGSTHVRAYRLAGRFSGDAVNLTIEDHVCPPRHGVGTRRAATG